MSAESEGQVEGGAAEIYERFFVPALFAEWPDRILDRCDLSSGDSFLDIACGTGILARKAGIRVGDEGLVAGLDANEGMLAVAAREAPEIRWISGFAENLPFPDSEFSAVASQFGLMFFSDRPGALSEMKRVTKPGGRIVVAVWGDIAESPGYARMLALLDKLFGESIADELRAPFSLGNRQQLAEMLAGSGITDARIERLMGQAKFPSIASWVKTEIKGWTLAERLSDDQFSLLEDAAQKELAEFALPDGSVQFEMPAIIATATG